MKTDAKKADVDALRDGATAVRKLLDALKKERQEAQAYRDRYAVEDQRLARSLGRFARRTWKPWTLTSETGTGLRFSLLEPGRAWPDNELIEKLVFATKALSPLIAQICDPHLEPAIWEQSWRTNIDVQIPSLRAKCIEDAMADVAELFKGIIKSPFVNPQPRELYALKVPHYPSRFYEPLPKEFSSVSTSLKKAFAPCARGGQRTFSPQRGVAARAGELKANHEQRIWKSMNSTPINLSKSILGALKKLRSSHGRFCAS